MLGVVYGVFWQNHTRTSLSLIRNAVGAWFFTPSAEGLEPLAYFGTVATHGLTRSLRGEHAAWW